MKPTALKSLALLCAFAALASAWALPDGLQPGIGRAEVVKLMGEPRARIESGNVALLRYDTCQIRLRDGVVEKVVAIDSENAESTADMLKRVEAERSEVGERLLARYRASGEIAQRSPLEQIAFWNDFRARYPALDVESELEAAEARLTLQKKEQEWALREAEIAAYRQIAADRETELVRRISYSVYPYAYRLPHFPQRHPRNWDKPRHDHRGHQPVPQDNQPPAARIPTSALGDMSEVFTPMPGVRPLIDPRRNSGR